MRASARFSRQSSLSVQSALNRALTTLAKLTRQRGKSALASCREPTRDGALWQQIGRKQPPSVPKREDASTISRNGQARGRPFVLGARRTDCAVRFVVSVLIRKLQRFRFGPRRC
jgi:hypothetical protein